MRSTRLVLSIVALSGPLAAQAGSILFSNSNPNGGKVEVAYAPQLVPQSGITVEAWVTYDGTTLGTSTNYRWPTILRTGFVTAPNAFNLRVDAGNSGNRTLKWTVNANGRVHVRWPFQPGQMLAWTHVAATYDGTEARLFVNGQQVGSAALTGAIQDVQHVLRIGQGADNAAPDNEVWNGHIDEVRLWPFARTAGEIQATMNMELSSVPGLVSTWNFNNNTNDSSSTMHGTLSGSGAAYSSNVPPGLTPRPFPGVAFGADTSGCLGAIHASATTLPQLGNADFAFVAHDVPSGAPAIALLGTGAGSGPLRIAGIDLWLDPNGILTGLPATVDAAGTARLPLPVPTSIPVNLALTTQFVMIDPCGPAGLTASDGLAIATVQ